MLHVSRRVCNIVKNFDEMCMRGGGGGWKGNKIYEIAAIRLRRHNDDLSFR